MEETNYEQIYSIENDNWWYKAKKNLFQKILKAEVKKRGEKFHSALDLGCGVGSNLAVLQKYSEKIKGLDNSPKAVQYCREKGWKKVFLGDIQNLKAESKNSYDLVLCSDVLEHVDDIQAVKEISRILAPGGLLVFSVPAHKYLWNDNDDLSHHRRRYEKKRLKKLLAENFKIKNLGYWNFSTFFPALLVYKINSLDENHPKTNNLNLIPGLLNNILYSTLKIENCFFQTIGLPQGISIIGICKKRKE